MEELYTDEVKQADKDRSREMLARLSPADALVATSLMEMSFRAGVAEGIRRAQGAMLAYATTSER